MILIITLLILVVVVAVVCYILTRRVTKFVYRAKHFQWLWNNGLHESAYIIGPDTFDWMGFN